MVGTGRKGDVELNTLVLGTWSPSMELSENFHQGRVRIM